MGIDRRKLFALGGLGALAGVGGTQGAELGMPGGGVTVRLFKDHRGWVVAVPDWDYVNSPQWHPGHVVPVVGMPLAEFLAALDQPASA